MPQRYIIIIIIAIIWVNIRNVIFIDTINFLNGMEQTRIFWTAGEKKILDIILGGKQQLL
jgi:hypothetical protein